MNDKSIRKLAAKANKKLDGEIYFNKKKRKEWKRTFLKTQKSILEDKSLVEKPVLKEEYDKRTLATSMLVFTVTGLKEIEKAENFDKTVYLTNCKFTLFKKGEFLVFKSVFLKPLLDKKTRTSYFCFPQGFPKTTKKKTYIVKDEKEFSLKGYREIDSGTFKQRVFDHKIIGLSYNGKDSSYEFKLTLICEEKQSYWANCL